MPSLIQVLFFTLFFSRHAKRVSVQSDDVLLLSRKNPKLEENLKSIQASTKNSKKNSS